MLDRLPSLKALQLDLPLCCGLSGVTLNATYPNLRSFHLSSVALDPNELSPTFFESHPGLESLSIEGFEDGPFQCWENRLPKVEGVMPHLKALRTDQATILAYGGNMFHERRLAHIQLRNLPDDMISDILNSITGLKCLEISYSFVDLLVESAFADVAKQVCMVPQQQEFGMLVSTTNYSPEPLGINSSDLISLLGQLDAQGTEISALRICDPLHGGKALPDNVLEDLGPVPPSLQYIRWDVNGNAKTYYIESSAGMHVAVETADCSGREKVDWTSDSIFDHLGALS